jgi:hypothetical protein
MLPTLKIAGIKEKNTVKRNMPEAGQFVTDGNE